MASKAFPGSLPDAPLNAPVPLASSQPQTLVIPVAVPTDSVLNKSGGSQEAQHSHKKSVVNKILSFFSTVAQTPANETTTRILPTPVQYVKYLYLETLIKSI